MRILIVEDEYKLADAVADRLRRENYAVDIALNGDEGLYYALTDSYDLIVLDIMLPGSDGFEILRRIRSEGISSRVIMLTAKTSIDDKLEGLTGGASDYLTKPFHMDELAARIAIQLRGARGEEESRELKYRDICLNLENMQLSNCEGDTINLSRTEFQLLELLMNNPDRILTKDRIYEKIWGYDSEPESNKLEAYLSFVRKKFKAIGSEVTIKAVRGVGYRIV